VVTKQRKSLSELLGNHSSLFQKQYAPTLHQLALTPLVQLTLIPVINFLMAWMYEGTQLNILEGYSLSLLLMILFGYVYNVLYAKLYSEKIVVDPKACSVFIANGSSSGLSAVVKACIRAFSEAGFVVAVGVSNEELVKQVDECIENRENAEFVSSVVVDCDDVSSLKLARNFVHRISYQHGRTFMGALVKIGSETVGVMNEGLGPVELVPLDIVQNVFRVNVMGPLATVDTFLPSLREGARILGKGNARIVMLTSVSGLLSGNPLGIYNASKASIQRITDSIRNENHAHGVQAVTVNHALVRDNYRKSTLKDDPPTYAESILETDKALLKSVYPQFGERTRKVLAEWKDNGKHPYDDGVAPEEVARAVLKCMLVQSPEPVNIVSQKILIELMNCFPRRWQDSFFRKMMPVN